MKTLILSVLLFTLSSSTFAATEYEPTVRRSKFGIGGKALFPSNGSSTIGLLSLEGSQYFGVSPGFFGFQFDFGQPTAGTTSVYYSFLIKIGYEKINDTTIYGGSLGAGTAAFGTGTYVTNAPNGLNYGTLALQPEVFGGFILGHGWRILGTAGYLGVTSAPANTGMVLGIRFDYKSETSTRPLDE